MLKIMKNKEKKVTAFVPIKLESERIPKKNLKLLGGKPLYRFIIETLSKVRNIHKTYIFCSDDSIANNLPNNVEFLKRDKKLDSNDTLGEEIYDNFIDKIDSDFYILAHTTSPFISSNSIEISIDKVLSEKYDSSFSVSKHKSFGWYNNNPINYSIDKIPKTQDLEPIYIETSGFYIFSKKLWKSKKRRIGSNPYKFVSSNIESIDIDDHNDFLLAEYISNNTNNV